MDTKGTTLFRLTSAFLAGLPEPARSMAARISAVGSFCLSHGKRHNVQRNLDVIGFPAGSREILDVFRYHSINIIEMFVSARWSGDEIRSRIEFPCREVLDGALSAGRGAIFATAHIGNWELPALMLASSGYRLSVVAGEQMNPLLTGPVKRAKQEAGIDVIGPESPYRTLYRALLGGGIVALLLDGDVFEGGVPATMFGRRVTLPRGAARLAMGTGSPVIGTFCRRLGNGRSRISMEVLLGAGEAALLGEKEAQARIFSAIERYIGENADQWCIFRDFWEDAA